MNLSSQQTKAGNSLYLTAIQADIIKCLLYFDIFNYPLTGAEIFQNSAYGGATLDDFERGLIDLVNADFIAESDGYYFLPERESIVNRRWKLNASAQSFWPKAITMSRLISGFPFVDGVFITGSLAKNCMEADGDIDYLIITRPGRLWVCRALLTAYKKIVLLNQRKYFCVNYYISSEALLIPDENVFTATEIINAVPTYNPAVCESFYQSNAWIFRFYPNKPPPDYNRAHNINTSTTKRLLENFFDGWIGEQADRFSFRLFVWRWKRKFAYLDPASFEINFRSRRHVSKHHPQGFQLKVLAEYEKRIQKFENEYSLSLV
jgi:hypothetical protein